MPETLMSEEQVRVANGNMSKMAFDLSSQVASLERRNAELVAACKSALEFHGWLSKHLHKLPEDMQQDIGEYGGEVCGSILILLAAEGE